MPRDARAYLSDVIEACDAITNAVRGLGSSEIRGLPARPVLVCFAMSVLLYVQVVHAATFTYRWEMDETREGVERANMNKPVRVLLMDTVVETAPHSAALQLKQKYSVHLSTEWSAVEAFQLLRIFETIPQPVNNPYGLGDNVAPSFWTLSQQHIHNDVEIRVVEGHTHVTLAAEALDNSQPLLATIDGIVGHYYSKRLHHAVVHFVTSGGADRQALEHIFEKRFGITLNIPSYEDLTKSTTKEGASRFMPFKNEELMAIAAMLEEHPQGMHITPGLKYLVRRLDGTPNPWNPQAPAIAYTTEGYIEFMEQAFATTGPAHLSRLIVHEKAHFLWHHLFDDRLKQDWIALGGWYENADDTDGWSTTKHTEFVSAYSHRKNPNEDMAESIAYYIVNPDKLRSRSPAKYTFIQDRVMHGTRYLSRIREDLTFQVYNLYPDVVYPGKIVRVEIEVRGTPQEDKTVTIEIETHGESERAGGRGTSVRVFSTKNTFFDIWLSPVARGGLVLRGQHTLSKHAAHGYWSPDQITLTDAHGNERHEAQTDFGWKLYLDNPLSDDDPPVYVRNSMRLALSENREEQRPFQVLTARWHVFEEVGMTERGVWYAVNDDNPDTYAYWSDPGDVDPETGEAVSTLKIPDYFSSGVYSLNYIVMRDVALNTRGVYFTQPPHGIRKEDVVVDEAPATVDVKTRRPDLTPPVLDVNAVTIRATPTNPKAPNGETRVYITFRIKDDISGYEETEMMLRDPNGGEHFYRHYDKDVGKTYFTRDPAVFVTYNHLITLPVGSIPGTWGLAEMVVEDKAHNRFKADFTEIVRFVVADPDDGPVVFVTPDFDLNGTVDFGDFVLFAARFGTTYGDSGYDPLFDLDADGNIAFSDFLIFAVAFGQESTSG